MGTSLRFLSPCLRPRFQRVSTATRAAHLRFYSALQPLLEDHEILTVQQKDGDVERRLKQLDAIPSQLYPRVKPHNGAIDCKAFVKRYDSLKPDQTREGEVAIIRGRIQAFRIAGSKLVFIDIAQEGHSVQGVCDFGRIQKNNPDPEGFNKFVRSMRKGDVFSFKGMPHKTRRGGLSVLVTEIPQLLSPCLHHLPADLHNEETRIRNRHVEFLVNPKSAQTIRLRSDIIQSVRQFLQDEGHTEVQTPILAAAAGGAVAKPFETSALEFPGRHIAMRTAPELWLKRMILGGFDRVFEIGVDLNHNPEFTTCEFYRTYADVEELISMTEKLVTQLYEVAKTRISQQYRSLKPRSWDLKTPFDRIDFVPALEAAVAYTPPTLDLPAQTETRRRLPDLSSPDAERGILQLFQDLNIPQPAKPTLPRLLDRLSTIYLERDIRRPTFIINHPECLSPLAKTFIHPANGQRVGARAELFVDSMEIANMYEEENSPFEQRRKFVQQLPWKDDGDAGDIDENYIEALEWGLPPTGGWGCGLDRLCMLLAGTSRIADVLAFGTLRNVVALGRGGAQGSQGYEGTQVFLEPSPNPTPISVHTHDIPTPTAAPTPSPAVILSSRRTLTGTTQRSH